MSETASRHDYSIETSTGQIVRRRALRGEGPSHRVECPACGGEGIVRDRLRRTYVTLMFEAGLALEEIGDYVGHNSAYMTDRYRHCAGHEARAAEASTPTSSGRLAHFLARSSLERRG